MICMKSHFLSFLKQYRTVLQFEGTGVVEDSATAISAFWYISVPLFRCVCIGDYVHVLCVLRLWFCGVCMSVCAVCVCVFV